MYYMSLYLLNQTTQPLASLFIAMHHNATPVEELTYGTEMRYITGLKDVCAVFFYTLIAVVVHAVIQEYLLDVSYPSFPFVMYHMLKKMSLNNYITLCRKSRQSFICPKSK